MPSATSRQLQSIAGRTATPTNTTNSTTPRSGARKVARTGSARGKSAAYRLPTPTPRRTPTSTALLMPPSEPLPNNWSSDWLWNFTRSFTAVGNLPALRTQGEEGQVAESIAELAVRVNYVARKEHA